MSVVDILLLLAAIAYAIAATAYYLAVARRSLSPESLKVGRIALQAGLFLHLLQVVKVSVNIHACPVTSVQFAISLSGLVTVGIFLLLASRARIEPLGALVAPLGMVTLISAQFLHGGTVGLAPPRLWLAIHVTSNVLGVGLFMMSAGVGAAYLKQSSRLKSKRAATGERTLPGLLPLERLMRRLLLIGFVPLSLGVTTGSIFADRLKFGGVDAMRVILSYGLWLLAGVIVVGSPLAGWRGRRIAWGVIAGALVSLVVVLLYVFGPKFVGGR